MGNKLHVCSLLPIMFLMEWLKNHHKFVWKIQYKGTCQEISIVQGIAKYCLFYLML